MKLAPSIQYLHKFYKNVTGHKHNFSFNAYRVTMIQVKSLQLNYHKGNQGKIKLN